MQLCRATLMLMNRTLVYIQSLGGIVSLDDLEPLDFLNHDNIKVTYSTANHDCNLIHIWRLDKTEKHSICN